VGDYVGVKYVLDLEACLEIGGAGDNRKAALFEAAKETRIAITSDVFKQIRHFDKNLADEFENSDIEIIDCDEAIYQTVENLAALLATTTARLNRAANEKLPIIAMANRAQNGSLPKCAIVTGDLGTHKSSMTVLCTELRITVIAAGSAF